MTDVVTTALHVVPRDTPGARAVMIEFAEEVPGDPTRPTHPANARRSRLSRWWHRRADERVWAARCSMYDHAYQVWVDAGRPTKTVLRRMHFPSAVIDARVEPGQAST